MNFIKNHWFGLAIWIWVIAIAMLMIVVLISPHYDAKNRGFAFCTQQLVENLSECERKVACSFSAILNNTRCDVKIIYNSIIDWIDNKHAYPWSGFIFEVEILSDSLIDEEERQEYLEEYPDTLLEMEKLKKLGKDLENAQDEYISKKTIIPQRSTSGMGLE